MRSPSRSTSGTFSSTCRRHSDDFLAVVFLPLLGFGPFLSRLLWIQRSGTVTLKT
ncbi:hypothetical protein BN903_98 [Halorubrum sp. AJ67]|nr:hypothetical protein BN903_98 [Halorubrum sp. AJ67]